MRLPHPCNDNLGFLADDAKELVDLIGSKIGEGEGALIERYFEAGLPPVTSPAALSALFGYSRGFIWSLLNRPRRHYRSFRIPKGREKRQIFAPRVGLKLIQKWLGTHFQRRWSTHESVYGFVPGRSHLAAAACHLGQDWVVSVDIENFFPSVTTQRVESALTDLGYVDGFSKGAIVKLTCFNHGLTQGAPSSPVLSNVVLNELDVSLSRFAASRGLAFTRYADDIVMSGKSDSPKEVLSLVQEMVAKDGWKISARKSSVHQVPGRLKVHGLLVHGDRVRLTKGYRNRIRLYKHLLSSGKFRQDDFHRLQGHVEFSDSVDRFNEKRQA